VSDQEMVDDPIRDQDHRLPTTGQVTDQIVDVLASHSARTDEEVRAVLARARAAVNDATKEDLLLSIWLVLEDIQAHTGLTLLQGLRQIGCRDELADETVGEASVEKLRQAFELLSHLAEVTCRVAEQGCSHSVVVESLRFGDKPVRPIDHIRNEQIDLAIVAALSYPRVFLDELISSP